MPKATNITRRYMVFELMCFDLGIPDIKNSQYFFWLCMHLKQEKTIFALILKE